MPGRLRRNASRGTETATPASKTAKTPEGMSPQAKRLTRNGNTSIHCFRSIQSFLMSPQAKRLTRNGNEKVGLPVHMK